MGQKVNPVGMRIGVNKDWNSRWYADDKAFHVYLNEDIKIRNYLTKQFKGKDVAVSHYEIERKKVDEEKTSVVVHIFTARPGVILGQEGKGVKELTEKLQKELGKKANVRISVVAVQNPDLDANLVAQSIAQQLEARASFRTVQKKAIQKVRKAGAKGCRTIVSGRLGGADIARGEGYKEGIIPLHTLRSDIDYAVAEAATQYGRLGVKVWICRGEVRPQINKKGE